MLVFNALATGARNQLAAAGIAPGNIEVHRALPTDDSQLPWCGVSYGHDDAASDGDARTGPSGFLHKTTLIVDYIDAGNDGADVRAKLASAGEAIMQSLMSDWTWGKAYIEGISGVRQIIDRPVDGARIVERVQLQIDVLTRSIWPTFATNDFTTGVFRTDADGDGIPDFGGHADIPPA